MFNNLLKFLSIIFLLALFLFPQNSFAQLTGIKTIPGDYATIALAVTDLNTQGVGSGGVTFNIAAGYTESITAPIIVTATGTSGNAIVFQKSGSGANPLITRTDAGVLATSALGGDGDAIIRLNGTDYITFEGIDVTAPDQGIEYGYMTHKPSATDGCQFVTIKNCNVTMTKGTSGFVMGIYIGNGTTSVSSATGVVVTATSGINSNIAITGNTVQNVHAGVYVRGSSAAGFYDSDVNVGYLGVGNTIQNYGGGSATSTYGVYFIYVNNPTVAYNNINNAGGGGTAHGATLYGIFYSTVLGNVVANANNFTLANTSASSSTYFIYSGNTVTSEDYSNNTFASGTISSTGSSYLIYVSNATNNKTISGNSTIAPFNRAGVSGSLYCYYNLGSPTGGTETITNNNFSNMSVAGSSSLYGIYSNTAVAQNRVWNYNTISSWTGGTGSTYAIYAISTLSNQVNNNNVNGITAGGTVYGIYFSGTNPTVYNNEVHSITTSGATCYGIYDAGTGLTNCYKNQVYDITVNNVSPILYGFYITSGATNYVYNNYVSDLKTPIANAGIPLAGIYASGGTMIGLYYNTIFLNATSSGALFGSAGVYSSTTPTLDMRDNIIVNLSTPMGATGFTAAYRRSTTTLTSYSISSNNNDFYAGTPGVNNLIFYDGTNSDQTMAAYKGRVAPSDASSFSENAPFVNATTTPYDLHINTAVATQIESGGIPISSPIAITDDFDGHPRNVTTPDVGADEFSGIGMDLTPPSIVYTSLPNTGSTSSRTLVATITDASGVPTTALGWPNLYWKINLAGTWSAVTPTSVVGSAYTYNFGSGVIVGDTVYYYVVAQDNATTPNVGSYPSLGAGGFTINPPAAAIPPTYPSSYFITQAPLSGSYTVGLALFNKLSDRNITFEKSVQKVMVEVPVEENSTKKDNVIEPTSSPIIAGTKTKLVEVEKVSWIPMENGKAFNGDLYLKKAENPDIIYPDGVEGVYASITAALADLNLRGVGGATTFLLVDTLYSTETLPLVINVTNTDVPTATNTVTIKPNTGVIATIAGASAGAQVFKILNSYVTFDGSNSGGTTRNLTIANTSATTPQVILIGSLGTVTRTNVTVKNCSIINGINTSSAFIISDGTTAGSAGWFKNITVQNNSIQKAYIGAYCNAVISSGNGSGLLLSQNSLNTLGANSIAYTGLYLQGIDSATVSQNQIANFDATGGQDDRGIWFATGTRNSIIERNTINTLKYSGTSGYGAYGIAISTATTGANVTIKNNMIFDISGDGWSYTSVIGDNPHGIYIFSVQTGINVYYNSIKLSGNTLNQTSALSTGICIGTGTVADVRDNIVINNLGLLGAVGYGSAGIFLQAASTQLSLSNNNDLFVAPTGTGAKNVAQIAATGYTTLLAWQTASSFDLNSVSDSVAFTSATDLHIPNGTITIVESAGTPISGITTDIDGQTRNVTKPDIGADEFNGINPSLILSGDYYIPKGSNPKGFNTLAEAITELNTWGVSSAVRFLIDDNLNEVGANLLITRSDLTATNNLTIKPAAIKTPTITITGCTTTAGASQYSGISYSGASYITIDGSNTDGGTTRDLTIAMNDSLNGRIGIQIYGNTDYLVFKNFYLKFNLINLTSTSTRGFYANGQASGVADSVIIENCQFADVSHAGAYAISITGSSGSSIYASKIHLLNNELYGTMRPVYFYFGGAAGTTSEIYGNTIQAAYAPPSGNVVWGILFNTFNGTFNIHANKLQTLISASSATNGLYGIGTLTSQPGVQMNIYNNFLGGNFQHTGTGIPASVDVISFQDNIPLANVMYNTIVLNNVNKPTAPRLTGVRWGGTANVNIKDNIVINENDAATAYALYNASGTFTSNYNDLYVSGALANIGYNLTQALKTFSAWQDSTGQDANSLNIAAPFAAPLDFHIPDGTVTFLESAGTPISGITIDIDGQTRNVSNPDIGADEFAGLVQIYAPSNLTAVADTFAVLLNWTDNSSNELGFYIERKNGDSLSVDPFVRIDSVGINAVTYNDLGRTPNTTYTYRVQAFNLLGVSPYSNEITTTTIIPVELTSFVATANEKEISISWTTATELNNRGFDLERKLDGEWKKVAFVEGKGTTTEKTDYSYTDKFAYESFQGTVDYRLKQIDFNGSMSYSKVISVEVDFTPKEYSLYQNYPNPFNPSTTIKFALPFDSNVRITIYNLLGEQVEVLFDQVKEVGYHNVNWNASSLASGVYFYTIEAKSLDGLKNFSSVKKMMLVK